MKQFVECSVPLKDLANDTIDSINSLPVGGITASTLVAQNPSQFWFENNTLGKSRLCTIRIDGEKMNITFTSANVQYTEHVDDFVPIPVIGPHPHHTPGAPRPK